MLISLSSSEESAIYIVIFESFLPLSLLHACLEQPLEIEEDSKTYLHTIEACCCFQSCCHHTLQAFEAEMLAESFRRFTLQIFFIYNYERHTDAPMSTMPDNDDYI